MRMVKDREDILNEVNSKDMTLVYFGNESCGVCVDLKPKVEKLLEENFPKLGSMYVDVEKSLKLAAEFQVFTIPALIVYADGKEVIKEARHMSVLELENKIDRYYKMLF